MIVTYCLAEVRDLVLRDAFTRGRWVIQALAIVLLVNTLSLSQLLTNACAQVDQFSEDEQKQIAVAARFLTVLEKSPRRGTALERIYGHHVEFGTLDKFLQDLKDGLQKSPDNGSKWMLLGLFESQRGEDGAAIEAFKKAEDLRASDPLPAYYAAQSMIRLGYTDGAVAAMERAIARKPQRADLMEIYQNLGRVYQRAQRTEKALEVWKRFEAEFPDDVRVLEQIARILSDENQLDQALGRYERLSKLVKDDYQRTNFRIAAAELKIRSKKREQGLLDFETILSDLNPESWLHRDVRRRIEDVFLKSNDQDSLVGYYQKWLDKNAEDVDAMARLAKFLSSSGRVPEATQWMEKALKLAPSRSELRKAFIEQLVEQQRYDDANEQYRKLADANPGNIDYLRDWGRLVLRNKDVAQKERNARATTIWNRMLDGKDKDALVYAQVADLFRNAGMNDRALELYQKAVDIEPGQSQYREYLGEFYHIQKRSDDALKSWSPIAEGKLRTAENVTRLAEIYQSFGYYDKAVAEIQEACKMQPKDFALNLQAAEYHNRASKYDDALKFIDAAEALADNDDQREAGLKAKIEILQSAQRLEEVTKELESTLAARANATEHEWYWLARCQEARREWSDAMESIEKALAIHADWIPALTAGARIQESSGDFGRAADLQRRLAQADKRSRDDHLMSVARLEMQLGRMEQAIKATEELITASPSNTDNYLFIAQIYERFGKDKEALDALRKAVRINPDDPALMMTLARSLGEKLQTREAIELYWRAFDKSDNVDDQVSLTTRLVELYEQINQFDQIVERFQRERQEEDKRRQYTICLAQAYQTVGDLPSAKQELLSLLSEDTRDTNLLQQVAKLCQANGEMDAAIGYQRKLVEIAPGHETEFPLATMLLANGSSEESTEIMVRLTQREEDPTRLVRSLDALLGQDRNEVVLQIVGQKLGQQRDDWELLYREGVAWMNSGKYEEAKHSFEQLLALKLPIESMSHAAEARFKQAQNKAKSDEAKGLAVVKMERPGPFEIASQSYEVRNVVIPNADQFFNPSVSPTRSVWAPSNYGLARMAGFGWLMRRERLAGQSNVDANEEDVRSEIERQVQDAASKPDASMSALYDWFFLATLLEKQDELRSLARRFAEAGGKRERDYYMSTLYTRIQNKQARQQQNQNAVEPLSDDELAFVIKCYEASKKGNQGQEEAPAGNVIVSGGRVYVRVGNSYRLIGSGTANYVGVVANELRLAGKTDEAAALIKKEIEAARTVSQLGAAMTLSLDEGLLDLVPERFDQWYTAAIKDIKARPVVAGNNMLRGTSNSPGMSVAMIGETTTRWLGKLAIAEENQQILAILDKFLDVAREEVKYELAVDALKKTKPNYVDTQMQSQWYFGDQSQYIQTTTPLGMSPVEMQKLSMIRVVYEILNRNGVPEDLVPMLKKRMEGSSGQDRVVELMNLAVVKWWSEDKEEAVELILSAVDQMPSREKVAIQVAELLNKVADYDRALEYLDKVNARDQRTMLQREMLALNVAERAGDIDRAQKAAERLFGLRLNAQQQSELLVSLQRLGRPDLADAILARVERTAGNQVSSLGSLMSLYAAQGRTDEANQIALQILQRTSTPMVSPASLVRMGRSYANSNDSAERSRAILTLQQSRQLDAVIEKIEKQLAENPESQKLSEQLVEFYEVSGKTDKAIELIKKVSQLRPKVVSWKYKLAQIYRQTGKMDEACTLYLDIIQLSPAMLNNEFYELRSMFRGAKRTGELTKALLAADFQGLRQYYYIVDMANDMLRENPSSTEAIDLIEKCLREYKQEKEYILGNIRSPEAWKNDKFFNIAIQTLIPTPTQAKLDPWFGLKQIRSYSSGGRVDSTMSTVMTTLAGTDKLPKMQEKIDDVVKAAPQWIAGKFITAVLATKTGHEKEGIEQIKALMKDDSIIEAMTPTTCWIVGQDVVKIPELREQARKLLEKAKDDQSMRSNGIEYSPIVLLVDAYHAENEREKIRELLLGYTKKSSNDDPYNREYYNYRHMESLIFIVNQLNRLGMAEDTAAVCMEALMQKDAMAAANQYSGRSTSYASQFQALFNSALDSLSSQDPKILVSRLVGGEGSKNPIFNLSVSANTIPVVSPDVAGARPTVNQANQPPELRNEFLIFIKTMSDKPGFSSVLKERLQELFVQHPDDFSVNVVCAYIDLLQRSDSAKASTQRVLDFLNAHPLEEIPEGRRANSRQRKEAADRIVVWLLAKEMMGTSQWDSQGEVLAKHALQAAKRQSGYSETETITNEWASLAIKANNKTRAENLWQELLKSTAIRPVSKSSKEAGSQSSKLPPLTQSQFKIVTDIAQNAAKNGMPQLSMLAMRESLKGGMPVADVAPANANGASLQAYTVVSSGSRSGAPTAPQISNEQAAVQVMNVLKIWDQNTYDVQETLDLLQSFVFPVSLKQEIYLYGSNAALANAKSESLGRMLMEWAAAAGKTDEVLKQAEERAKSPDTKLTYMALKTFSALNLKNLPEAKTNLQLIVQSLAAANTEAAANTALHAALPATSEPELKTEAFQIIEKAVLFRLKQISMTNRSADAPKDELTTMYQKYLLANEGLEKIKEYFENRLLVSQQYANRYSGEYAIYLQKQDLANAAVELANAGKLDLSMDYLGRSANVILVERYGDTSNASFSVILQSRKLPIDKQYQLWKDWTMPTAQRQSIRFTSAAIPAQHTPKVFQKEDWNHEELKQYSIWSNFHELVRAAKATSQLEETKQLADKALAEGQAAARVLSLMCAIELKQPDLDQQLSTYFEDTNKALTDTNTQNRQTDNKGVGSVLLQCLRESSYFSDSIDRMEKYDRFERERNLSAFRSQALLGFLDSFSMKKNHKPFEAVDNRLAHWITGLLTTPNYTNKPAWWFVERDNLRKLGGGSTTEGLIFAYPVAGEFEFVADCFEGGWGECDIGFNGAMPRPLYYQSPIPIETLSQQERLQRKPALKNSRPGYDQQRIVSDGKTVKFYFNNYLFYQEPISPTSPWVMLHSTGYNLSNFRNMRFTKKPQILNEVNLIGEKMLDGWGSSMFGESLPAERIRAEKIEDRNSYAYHQQNQLANGTDYYIRKDEMIADAKDGMEKQQGWIYYQRSMRPQDTFAYEFFYEPGKFQAWPTFGPLVLLLDSNKEVRSHWISSNATLDQSDFDFSVVEQGCQKVTNLPFKDKDWNKLELSKSDQTIQVKLNGELIFERPFNDIHDHRFGIFHYRNKSLRVRNAKLTGNWPKEMSDELNSNLIAVTKEFSNEERFVIDALPLTTIYEPIASDVVKQARSIGDEKAYPMLLDWVVPDENQARFKMYFQLLSLAEQDKLAQGTIELERVLSPAVELVAVAKRQGKLDELYQRVSAVETYSARDVRAKIGLATLIDIEQNKFDDAKSKLKKLLEIAQTPLPKEYGDGDRAAEWYVILFAGRKPELWDDAWALANKLRETERAEESKANEGNWRPLLHGAMGALTRWKKERSGQTEPVLKQWTSVPSTTARQSAEGLRPSVWRMDSGVLKHDAGETWSHLFFQSPLRGKYEITARRSTFDYAEMLIATGTYSAEPAYDLKSRRLNRTLFFSQPAGEEIKIPNWDKMADFRMVVDGNKVTTYTNGVEVYQQQFNGPIDPWLVLQQDNPWYFGTIENLEIRGTPEIPAEIDLTSLANGGGWLANTYTEGANYSNPVGSGYQFTDQQIVGTLHNDTSSEYVESLLKYYRPMLEDGEIEFEFFYEAGMFEVHPVIGDNALLLGAGEVALHPMSDGPFDREGRKSTASQPIADAKSPGLKEKDWNQVLLKLVGDQVQLSVNGQLVATLTINDPANQRFFGLFRYRDKHEMKVRSVKYRGQWPMQLPATESQELALRR